MSTPDTVQTIDILLAEDNATDVMLTRRALKAAKIANRLHVVRDGIEAMAFLRREGKYREVPTPDLILLDLNMPKKDGRAVLAEIKEDPQLRLIPVVVLTTSSHEQDVLQAYGLHANCYILKPVDFEQFAEVIKSIDNFWFKVVILPEAPSP